MTQTKQGLFVAFEGGEGAGKSTQAKLLALALRARGAEVVLTREPGATPVGTEIRRLLLGSQPGVLAQRAELLLYSADRAQHVERVIVPALLAGQVVITDRYVRSTLAYQAAGRGLDYDMVQRVCDYATDGHMPHLTLFLDGDPSDLLPRAKGRGDANRFEYEELAFHNKVRASFLRQATSSTWRTVDAMQPISELHEEILRIVDTEYGWYGRPMREDH